MQRETGCPPDRARHGLVLWSARHETVLAQSILSEYLASHGFLVAAVERSGARLPAPFEIPGPARRLPVLEAQLADLDLALNVLLRASRVDSGRVALLAWSHGGESAAALQRRRGEVDLVIGLSSNIVGGRVYQLTDSLAHGNFNVVEGPLPGLFPEVGSPQPWSRGGSVAAEGYRAIAEATLAHLRLIRE